MATGEERTKNREKSKRGGEKINEEGRRGREDEREIY
jgi:hypothetical protein